MADNDKITELANRIYALDEKVYKATGSNLGRVYQGNKEKCINDLRDLIKSSADSSVLRSELALISNMARTTKKNPQLHKEIMHEYGEIFDEAMAMQEAREGNDIIDPEHAELNMSNLANRFGKDDNLIICIGRSYGCAGTDIGYENSSFVRVRNITLGYNFKPNQLGALSKLLSGIRVYVDVQNPFTFTGYTGLDPEVNTGGNYKGGKAEYPQTRTFSLGAKLSF